MHRPHGGQLRQRAAVTLGAPLQEKDSTTFHTQGIPRPQVPTPRASHTHRYTHTHTHTRTHALDPHPDLEPVLNRRGPSPSHRIGTGGRAGHARQWGDRGTGPGAGRQVAAAGRRGRGGGGHAVTGKLCLLWVAGDYPIPVSRPPHGARGDCPSSSALSGTARRLTGGPDAPPAPAESGTSLRC